VSPWRVWCPTPPFLLDDQFLGSVAIPFVFGDESGAEDHRISLVGQIYLAVGLHEASLQAPLECVIAGFLPLGEVG
jgi:hypothetical protein